MSEQDKASGVAPQASAAETDAAAAAVPDPAAAAVPDPAAAAVPDPAAAAVPDPAAVPAPVPAPAPSGRRRAAVLAITAALIIPSAILVLGRLLHHPHAPPAPAASSSPRSPFHAFHPPHLPGQPDSGTRLTGIVVDGAGLPVAGAEVTAEPERGVPDRALAGRTRPAATAARDAGPLPDAPSAAVAASPPTAADGRFAISGLEPGRYRLRVTGTGLLAAELRFVPVPSDEARIVVARQVAIDGTVTDGGQPVTVAMVGIRGEAIGGTLEVKTDTHGAFHVPNLPEGHYQVYAWQGALAARTIRVARLGAGPFPPVELKLEAGAIVVGRVIDKDEGTGMPAAIELRPTGDDQAPRYARAGDDGVFRIEGVPNGRWIADAFAPGYLSPGGIELEAGKGIPELALARGGAIEGRVVDGTGQPVAGAAVRAIADGPGGAEQSADVDLDRLRRYSGRTAAPPPEQAAATGTDPELLPRGELGVMVGPIPPLPPPGGAPARAATVVDPTVASAGAGLLGDPPALPADPVRGSIWVTGPDGHFRIWGLPHGKVTVLAEAPGFAEARSREVAIEPGQLVRGVDLVVSAGTYLSGRVTDQHGAPVIGAEVAARPHVGAPVEAFTDDDGEYRLGPVTGALVLHASAYGHVDADRDLDVAPVAGSVPGERHEDLVVAVADAVLAGTLEDTAGAPVAGAALEVIDGSGEGRHATVAADGTFSIELLPAGPVHVRVEHPAYPPAELDATASTTGERVRLVLPLGGAVEGVLLDATTGDPLAGLTISARGPAGATAEASTDPAGQWKLGPLAPGRWHVEARQPGYLAQSRDVEVPAASTPGATSVRDIRIELAQGALLGGTVRDDRGRRVSGAHVVIRTTDGSAAPVEADTDAAGEFRVHDCPTGEVVVTATQGMLAGATTVTVRPGDEVLGLAIDIK